MAAKVTAEDREKYAVGDHGDYPIKNKAQAASALKLRGHAKDKALRRSIIRRAAKFLPVAAKKAWEEDKKKGLI